MFQLSFLNAGLFDIRKRDDHTLLIWLFAKKKPPKVIFPLPALHQDQPRTRAQPQQIQQHIAPHYPHADHPFSGAFTHAPATKFYTFKEEQKARSHRAVAVILDNSYSMDASAGLKTRLELAKEAIGVINERANADDRLIFLCRDIDFNRLNSQIHINEIPSELFEKLSLSLQPASWQELIDFAQNRLRSDPHAKPRNLYHQRLGRK